VSIDTDDLLFRVSVARRHSGGAVVAVGGEADLYAEAELRQALSTVADADPLVVDLSDADFIDSTVLALLVGLNRDVERRGGRLVLVCDGIAIRRVFEVTGLAGSFHIERTLPALDGS
jgi:anti-sigma B factor antagonist